jgi:hypothetical protein
MKVVFKLLTGLAIAGIVMLNGTDTGYAQDNAAKDHAKRIIELLQQEKFEDVAREFNAQVASVMSATQLGEAWSRIRAQAGDFVSIIDQQALMQAGNTVVVSGCRFEKTNLNAVVAFDGDSKIAGLRFVPRPQGAD